MSTATSPSVPLDYTRLQSGDSKEPLFWGLSASAWVKVLVVTALLVALFRFNLARLWSKTNPITGEANWGHTPIIPVIGLFYLYLNRERLLAAPVKPIFFERLTRTRAIVSVAAMLFGAATYFLAPAVLGESQVATFAGIFGFAAGLWGLMMLVLGWGLGNLVFGLLVFAFGIYPGRNDWLSDYGMVHTIFGTVLTLCGWEVMKVAWFPIAFLVCGLPWPGLVYSWLANPLQHLAAGVAVKTLNVTGIDANREGTHMFILGGDGAMRPLNVAEACAGLRSLMTFISVAAAIAFLSDRALWQRAIITASAVPIAIFCNVMRVTGQAYLDRLAGREWSENFAHQFVGLVMLIPAFFLILGVGWLMDQLFIEEVDDKTKLKAAAAAKRAGRTSDKKIIVIPAKTATLAKAATPAAPVAAGSAPLTRASGTSAVAQTGSAKLTLPASAPAPARVPPRATLTGNPPAPAPTPSNRPVEGA